MPRTRTLPALVCFLLFAGCAGKSKEWQIDGGYATPERAIEAFLNNTRGDSLVSEKEFKEELFPRLPEKFRQGGRMNPEEGWIIESSFRSLVLSRLDTINHPVRITQVVERQRREQRDGIELIYPGSVSASSAGGTTIEIPYVRMVVGAGGRYKVAVLGTGD